MLSTIAIISLLAIILAVILLRKPVCKKWLIFGTVTVSLLAVGIVNATEQAQAWNGPSIQQKVHIIDVGQGDSSLKAVSSEYAVISCGEVNQYGHPHQVALDKLSNAGVQTFRTDTQGTAAFISDGKTLNVKTLKDTIQPRAPNTRLSGQSRYQTSKAVAESFNNGQVDNVILATGNNYADALSVSALAGQLEAPILLVDKTANQSQDALDYISKHMTGGKVWIIGGKLAIDSSFESKLTSMGNSVERIEGQNRYATCLATAAKENTPQGTPVFLATGLNFPDALSVASVAAYNGYPIILSPRDSLDSEVQNYLLSQQPSKVYIVGGPLVISQTVESKVKSILPSAVVTRMAGQSRFDTSVEVYKTFFTKPDSIMIASGMNYPDALSASVLAAKYNAPIILVDPAGSFPPDSTVNYLKTLDNPNMTIIGGTNVVPVLLVDNIKNILSNGTH